MNVNAFSWPCRKSRSGGRSPPARRNFETIAECLHVVRRGDGMADRRVVQPEGHKRPQFEPDRPACKESIHDVRGVLEVRHQYALLEPRAVCVVRPDR